MKSKHSVCAIILIVAIVGLILSCSNNPTLENKLEETGYVSFGNAGSRSLSVMYEMEDFDDLYWTYTAKKADGYGQTGQTTSEQPVPPKTDGKGIGDGTVGPFSMGDWDFNLFAYKDAEKTIKVYEGKTPSRVNIIAGDTKNVSVAVSPFGTTGVLNIENAYFHWDSTSGGALPVINLTMDMDKSDEITDQSFDITPVKENGDITFALNETIPVGFYYCKLKATIDTASTPIYETEEFTLRIYGATTTTIFGDITEQTGPNVVFSATKSDNSELAAITGTDVREVSVNATPAGSDTTTVNFGTYNIGTIETTSEDGQTTKVTHVLEVAVSSSDTVDTSDTNRFIVDDGKDAVAALDLNLIKTTEVTDATGNTTTTTEPVTTFGDGNEVTITTYVAKNLFDVKVRYNNGTDTPEEIDPESYDPSTGMLVFKVSHFSEYYVTAKLPEARIGNTYYRTLNEALEEAVDEVETITLLRDMEMNFTTIGTKSLSIDLNNHTLSNTGTNGTTITGGTEIKFSNGKLNLTGYASTAGMLCVETQSSLILENVEYVTTGAAIYPRGDAAKVLVKSCTITAPNSYCVATNAAEVDNYGVEIEIINSKLSGLSPVLVNVPCILNISGSTITGLMHGVVVRGGTAAISGSTITVQADAIETYQNYFASNEWGSGNMVNLAALTFGNKKSDAYQYPTNVTVTNSTIKAVKEDGTTGNYPDDVYPAIYGYGNSGEGLGATLTYDASTTVTGAIILGNDCTKIIRPDSSQE